MINVRMQPKEVQKLTPKITVIGVGGGGGNAVNNMIKSELTGVDFLVCNTDAQALEGSLCTQKIQLGETVTSGLGAGAKPSVGQAAAEESLEEVMRYLTGANMVFVTAGMGGGTGTGAAPVIARACRQQGILTVGVVTKPFHFEGTARMRMAEEGIRMLQEYVDTLLVIPNQNLFRVANEKTTFTDAFRMADSVLQSGVRGVTDLMLMPGEINLDFADIKTAMLEMGKAMMGTGEASGERRAVEAAEKAINNPLLDDVTMKGARGVIINVTGSRDMTLFEIDEACNRVQNEVDPNANIIFGSIYDETMGDAIRVSIIATGIDADEKKLVRGNGGSLQGASAVSGQSVRDGAVRGGGDRGNAFAASPAQAPAARPAIAQQPAATASFYNNAAEAAQARNHEAQGYQAQGQYVQQGTALAPEGGKERAELDMFDQFFGSQPLAGSAGAGSEPAVQQSEASASVRGTVYNNAFIPPKPAEAPKTFHQQAAAYQPQPATPQPSYEPATMQVMATRQDYQSMSASAGSTLNLKPPVPGANVAPKRKPASLFERFTNPLRYHDDRQDESAAGQGDETGGDARGETGAGGLRAPQHRTAVAGQGSLAIEAPRPESRKAEDELDIPAFLRRQAN